MLQKLKRLLSIFLILFFTFNISPDANAQVNDVNGHGIVNDLGITLKESLKAEEKNIISYKDRIERGEREKIYFAAAINGYQLRLSTYGNLLLSSGVDISTLQKTRSEIKSSLLEVQKMMGEVSPASETLTLEKKNLEQQKQLVDKQISELSKLIGQNKDTTAIFFEKTARQLAKVLKLKATYISKLDDIYQKRLKNLSEIQQAFSTLEAQYTSAIEQRKTKNLFERKKEGYRIDVFKVLKEDIINLVGKIKMVTTPVFWTKLGQKLWQNAGFMSISFLLIFIGALFALLRTKISLSSVQNLDYVKRLGDWHKLTASLLTQSIVPGGMALIVFIFSRLNIMYFVAPTLQMVTIFIITFLAVSWIKQAFGGFVADSVGIENANSYVKLSRILSIFILTYASIHSSLGPDSNLLVILRIVGAIFVLIWTLLKWKTLKLKDIQKERETGDKSHFLIGLGSKYLLITISGAAIIFDMIGYGSLSVHWLSSWTITIMIILWWVLFFNLIKEWDQYYKTKSDTERNEFLYDDYPVQWLMIRAGQFVWLMSLIVVILLLWGNQQNVLGKFYNLLAHPFQIGNMNFSLLGFISSVLVILITYAITRMWKWVFQAKFLSRSGMTIGLQDSITTITIYVIWLFGILVSLHVFGLNTASLAVAFGALGIGLGFGLGNIFNNFISGIILLFERPIQVGDSIEMNGMWAEVKKINVRSTVVQTYDNASLIIPNADLISNQVTNWSFKDKRIRRNISVGVAYGSDIELVRETLLEISKNTKKVLRNPKPDVVFRDFGDSALIFQLRVWTDIDHMLIVETDIRFKIDKLFKERKIEISFPQRDIHIRSIEGLSKKDASEISNSEGSIVENEE
jgi:small-conductance mechanosensitive channel